MPGRSARRHRAGDGNRRSDAVAGEGDVVRHRRRGRIFAASTNAFINTGDGLGTAARAGIPLEDMEFWQFHPTGVAGAGILITEAVRGEGGIPAERQR
jgi:aspartate oxidase